MIAAAGAYTSIWVNARGVVLFEQHCARLARAGIECERAFRKFAASAAPGAYSIRADRVGIEVRERPPSALFDGISTRLMISPYIDCIGSYPKPPPPSRYDSVRVRGTATLLTSADGTEIYESCTASVIAWTGERLISPPLDRPAVESTAIAALRAAGMLSASPIKTEATHPLALVNAVAGIRLPAISTRGPFPADIRAQIESQFASTTGR
jgi:hypothetical protein